MHRLFVLSILVSSAALGHADTPTPEPAPRASEVEAGSSVEVTFALGSARLNERAREPVEDIAAWHADHPDGILIIEGHASPDGSSRTNLRISQQRGEAVRDELVRAGADPSRIVIVALGDDRAAEATGTNRRVVVRASQRFPELAREQRDLQTAPPTGEDAAARRTTEPRRATGGVGTTSDAAESDAATGAAMDGRAGAGNTVIIVPGAGAGDGDAGAGDSAAGDGAAAGGGAAAGDGAAAGGRAAGGGGAAAGGGAAGGGGGAAVPGGGGG
jgi:hypothetical protein